MVFHIPSFRSLLAPIMALMQAAPPRHLPELFPGVAESKNSVDVYYERVINMMDKLMESSIMKMEYCKRRADKPHEFIIVTLSYPGTSCPAFLVVERTVADSSSSAADISLVSSPGAQAAADVVMVAGTNGLSQMLKQHHRPFDILATLIFDSPFPSAVDLARVSTCTSTHKPDYNVFTGQCYWFCLVIWSLMQKHFKCTESKKSPDIRGKYGIWRHQTPVEVEEVWERVEKEKVRIKVLAAVEAAAKKQREDQLVASGRQQVEERVRALEGDLNAAKLVNAEREAALKAQREAALKAQREAALKAQREAAQLAESGRREAEEDAKAAKLVIAEREAALKAEQEAVRLAESGRREAEEDAKAAKLVIAEREMAVQLAEAEVKKLLAELAAVKATQLQR